MKLSHLMYLAVLILLPYVPGRKDREKDDDDHDACVENLRRTRGRGQPPFVFTIGPYSSGGRIQAPKEKFLPVSFIAGSGLSRQI